MSDKKLLNLLSKYSKDIQNLAQVGAHQGQEIKIFENFNFEKIYLFEPFYQNVQVIEKIIENKLNYVVFEFALGNNNTKKEIFYSVENEGQSSSFLVPNLHKKVQPSLNFHNKLSVQIKRFEDLDINNVNFLIMDVQGIELEVLKGFGTKIHEIDFIFTEVNRNYLYSDNVLIWELDKYLFEKGFIRTWTSWREANMPWGDAFYLRTSRISKRREKLYLLKNLLLTNNLLFSLYRFIDARVFIKSLKKLLKF
jgi:FkbM family methyltransferase